MCCRGRHRPASTPPPPSHVRDRGSAREKPPFAACRRAPSRRDAAAPIAAPRRSPDPPNCQARFPSLCRAPLPGVPSRIPSLQPDRSAPIAAAHCLPRCHPRPLIPATAPISARLAHRCPPTRARRSRERCAAPSAGAGLAPPRPLRLDPACPMIQKCSMCSCSPSGRAAPPAAAEPSADRSGPRSQLRPATPDSAALPPAGFQSSGSPPANRSPPSPRPRSSQRPAAAPDFAAPPPPQALPVAPAMPICKKLRPSEWLCPACPTPARAAPAPCAHPWHRAHRRAVPAPGIASANPSWRVRRAAASPPRHPAAPRSRSGRP